MDHDPWAEQMQQMYEAPSAQHFEGGPQQFSYEGDGLYDSREPWDQPQEATYSPPPQEQAQQPQQAHAPPPTQASHPQQQQQPLQAQAYPPAPDPLQNSQALAWQQYQYESQLAAQRAANQRQLEAQRYQLAMQQLQGAPQAPPPYRPAPPSDLNRAYYARRNGFWVGLAVGAGGLLAALAIKSWWR